MTLMKAAGGAMLLVATLTSAATRADTGQRAASATRAPDAGLRVLVSPHLGRAPAMIRIEAFVEASDGNRALEFVVDSSTYYSSSRIELNGAGAPRVHRVEFRSVPAGTHDIVVALTGPSGAVRARVHDRVSLFE